MTAKWQDGVTLAAFAFACLGAGALAGIATGAQPGAWYGALVKPRFNPPGWVFGPVWTVLYVTMGVAAWLVWMRRDVPGAGPALVLFAVQLVLNVTWPVLFFAWQRPGLAFVEIIVLWAAIAATLWAFFHVRPAAGWLMVPYMGWVTFAAVLNGALWRMNA